VAAATAPDASISEGDPALAEIVRRLVPMLNPQRIYLFGSQSRGDADEGSDYDILIVVEQREDEPVRMEVRAREALWGIGVPIDLVVMTAEYFEWMLEAAASLPATVMREGRLLYAAA
jgi:predicted nucleotidyltransferase